MASGLWRLNGILMMENGAVGQRRYGHAKLARPPVTVRAGVFRVMWATDLAFLSKPITLTRIKCPRTLNAIDLSVFK